MAKPTTKSILTILVCFFIVACQQEEKPQLDRKILTSLGSKHKLEFTQVADNFKSQIVEDSTNIEAHLGLAETNIILFIFGFVPRDKTIPQALEAFQAVSKLDSLSSEIHRLEGMLRFLDWDWEGSQKAFLKAIETDPKNLQARHWYSLWLCAMGGRYDKAMAQSDTIMSMDIDRKHLIGRASLLYFQSRFTEMKPLMVEEVAKNATVPWGYDWLGMAYNGLEEHDDAIKTYFKAFELSDGTVEVGGGLGHALGHAGETKTAKLIADYYAEAAKTKYLPPCQRSFVHLGIGEYEEALKLLEQAYEEKSWFLIFMQIEHWYDPIRGDQRFIDIMGKMKFPNP